VDVLLVTVGRFALPRYGALVADDEVILEGGERHGQPVPLAALTHEGVGKYVLHDRHGAYRHDEEALSDFRNGQRVAVFEPSLPGRHVRLVDGDT
jgi:hypothetical protein